ncbi:MAG: putative VacJ like lipoprotein [Alphaproteobacteria bacterium]|nr:putative VacJ like lipoprotein [Alphaproteobacteria bacterium]
MKPSLSRPLARSLALVLLAFLASGCSTNRPYGTEAGPRLSYGDERAPRRRFVDIAAKEKGERQFAVYDPAEGVNKFVYRFNAGLDNYLLIPIVETYKNVTPEFVRKRIGSFFLNVGEVTNFTNAVLQGSPGKAGITASRFAINTTAGLLGTFDVATKIGIERRNEDFGQTLGVWGAGPGAFVVLPVLGPSNVRDAAGKVVDIATMSFIVPNNIEDETAYKIVAYGVLPIDARSRNDFRYFQSGSPFEYELVRYVVTQARKLQIAK